MNKNHSLVGFMLIGLGVYFLLRHLNIPELSPFYSWPSLLVIIGLSFLIHSYMLKDYSNLFTGGLIFGLGVHFLGVQQLSFWIDHWGVYLLIIGGAFLLQYQKLRKGLLPGLILVGIGAFSLWAPTNPGWFSWIQKLFLLIENFWPFVLIIFGVYLLKKKT
ncbi:LiaI-LiaF-like domain-containing protein [Halobacillus litoralis]|uniref:LiaI-LiaF-like domain-containing protein n=1 Tax=Halobacillus litoralis TaxID=45668 RepID=UPI001CFE9020|nr:DUF5668 domain-containing protein [Halobacillus litoralis]